MHLHISLTDIAQREGQGVGFHPVVPPADQGPGSGPHPHSENGRHIPAILRAGSPRAVLAKLLDGDPLELGARCAERIRRQALILDADRLHMRVAARVAHGAAQYSGKPEIGIWLAERIRVSLRELLAEDAEAALSGLPVDEVAERHLFFLVKGLGIEVDHVRRGVVTFNDAPYAARAAFFGVLVEQRGIAGHALASGTSPERVRSDFRRALRVLGTPPDFDLRMFEGEG